MMRKSIRNIILFFTGLVFLIGALIAFNMYNEGPVNVADGKAIQVNPISLYSFYTTDSVTAHKTYDGKIIQLTGEVSGITENTQKQQVILIKTSAAGGNINCTMEQLAAGIKEGSMISVKGICGGLGQGDADLGIAGDVYLTRTIMVN